MKILELVALILISLFIIILLFGVYVVPIDKIKDEYRRTQYSLLLRAGIWTLIYMLSLDFFMMLVLFFFGQS